MKININKITSFTGHSGAVYALDRGLTDDTFFSGSADGFIAMWNLQTLQAEKFAAKFPSTIFSLCHISEIGLLLAGTSTGSIHILDLIKKEEIKILQHHTSSLFDIKYSLLTNCFYSAGGDGNFAICSLDTFSAIKIKKLCNEKVRSIAINNHTSELAVASGDCSVRIFDLISLEEKNNFMAHKLSANKVCYSPDGKLLFTGGRDAHLNIWETENYTCVKSIPAHNFAIYDICFSPKGNLFATASRDKTIKIWDAETFEILVRINKENFDGHVNSVNNLLWNDATNYLVSASDDGAVMVWEILLNNY